MQALPPVQPALPRVRGAESREAREAPFVCSGCREGRRCVLRRRHYLHARARESHETLLPESRTGANTTEGELRTCDAPLRDLAAKGQSIHAAMANNPDRFAFPPKTACRYVDAGLLPTKRGDLPRACALKPRRGKGVEHRVDRACRVGRTWDDYPRFVEGHPGLRAVEMDTVEGARGGKALLTLLFNPSNFMLAFLVDAKTSACVPGVFSGVLSALKGRHGEDGGREAFARLFPVILTDNGTEFPNPHGIEFDADGGRLTSVFHCRAYASYEKPHVERNHEFIRLVLPKGGAYTEPTPFEGLTQRGVSPMMSHVNSYVRRGLGNKTPYDLFTAGQGEEIATPFGISRIAANDVTPRPSLLGVEVKAREGVSPAETVSAGKCPPVHRHTPRTGGGDRSHLLVPKRRGAPGAGGALPWNGPAAGGTDSPDGAGGGFGRTRCTFGTTRCDHVPSRHRTSRIYLDK